MCLKDARDQAYARRTTRRAEGRSAALAAGCRRNHRTMELPAPARRRVTRIGGVRGGQPGDDQDVRDHPTDLGADEVDVANVLRPRRTRHRHGRFRGFGYVLDAAFRPPVLHRFAFGRLTGAAGRHAKPRSSDARIGRQESGGGVATGRLARSHPRLCATSSRT